MLGKQRVRFLELIDDQPNLLDELPVSENPYLKKLKWMVPEG